MINKKDLIELLDFLNYEIYVVNRDIDLILDYDINGIAVPYRDEENEYLKYRLRKFELIKKIIFPQGQVIDCTKE